ncbi:putative polyketide synthase [Diaporthe ampelina]|uniref:Putative polyketide synthase n=1 Tax=Diaporthe ampelina TaxID=1214573 RepID=A0A0G2ICI8_9PEZI|nr:putative polyketide synthase [Diaporthe ampelina]
MVHVSVFDAGFFGISLVVASGMDPQPRLLLEVSYEAVIQARDTEKLPKYNAAGTSSNSTIANRVSQGNANFANHVALKTQAFDLQHECVLQQSSLGFDTATFQPIPLDDNDDDQAPCVVTPESPSALWRPFVTGMAGTVYRTGDKGRLLADGTLLCLGRLDGDTQIKLRGQRVELNEIESAVVQASGGALASVVVSRRRLDGGGGGGGGGDDVLIAHATLADPEHPSFAGRGCLGSAARARQAAAGLHPPRPSTSWPLVPTTSNGKLDRKAVACLSLAERNRNLALAEPNTDRVADKLTVRQGELRLLWEQVLPALGHRRIGPSSDFFLCGGNSLLIMKPQRAIKQTTGADISTKSMCEATTLGAMAHVVFDDPETGTGQDQARIKWEAETSVPAWLQEQIDRLETGGSSTNTAATEAEGIEVLLTGAILTDELY